MEETIGYVGGAYVTRLFAVRSSAPAAIRRRTPDNVGGGRGRPRRGTSANGVLEGEEIADDSVRARTVSGVTWVRRPS